MKSIFSINSSASKIVMPFVVLLALTSIGRTYAEPVTKAVEQDQQANENLLKEQDKATPKLQEFGREQEKKDYADNKLDDARQAHTQAQSQLLNDKANKLPRKVVKTDKKIEKLSEKQLKDAAEVNEKQTEHYRKALKKKEKVDSKLTKAENKQQEAGQKAEDAQQNQLTNP